MSQEQVSVQDAMPDVTAAGSMPERRREHKHPASELRRLIVAAARALPVERPLWFRKAMNPRWSR
jgi:hypothetical protein